MLVSENLNTAYEAINKIIFVDLNVQVFTKTTDYVW